MKNARDLAMHILYDIEYNGAYSNMALKNAFSKNQDLSTVDKGFITRIVYGVVSRKITLEYIISSFSKIKLKKISKYILIILKMGIYQLKYMDKVPESAAVNESVKLAKRYGHGASAGFVNGLLRSVIKNEIKYPDDEILKLSVMYSYPQKLCQKWCDDFGIEFTKELLDEMNKDSKITLRVNQTKTTCDELLKDNNNFEISPLYDKAVICDGFDVGNSEIYKSGKVIAQDISAMMASLVLAPQKGEKVLDICAAPGGKTTHLAELMQNCGEVVACDIHKHKIDLIKQNANRMGLGIIKPLLMDATRFNEDFVDMFDKVLADVPCSGYGIVKRKPDIKWKDDNIDEICSISKEILTNASKYVKIGGEIVFSTCTINKEENEI
ncbi:MAG: 16S rRNA (cytosine(967)-C(5))-methyltransferase RsmB, partial [Clostridia bacterium]|nr:16S rRNA (cytosine(967)-C(5))-methyltransferase RsmB [Clostridia bacterium]